MSLDGANMSHAALRPQPPKGEIPGIGEIVAASVLDLTRQPEAKPTGRREPEAPALSPKSRQAVQAHLLLPMHAKPWSWVSFLAAAASGVQHGACCTAQSPGAVSQGRRGGRALPRADLPGESRQARPGDHRL